MQLGVFRRCAPIPLFSAPRSPSFHYPAPWQLWEAPKSGKKGNNHPIHKTGFHTDKVADLTCAIGDGSLVLPSSSAVRKFNSKLIVPPPERRFKEKPIGKRFRRVRETPVSLARLVKRTLPLTHTFVNLRRLRENPKAPKASISRIIKEQQQTGAVC